MHSVVDVVLYNNERDLLDLRINILRDVVDQFIVIEAAETFQGGVKSCLVRHPEARVITLPYLDGSSTWERERYQRGYPLNLRPLSADAIILTGDVDEVPNPTEVDRLRRDFDSLEIYLFELAFYEYYLNVRGLTSPWKGTRACSLSMYETQTGAGIRDRRLFCRNLPNAGWHWSFLGGIDEVKRKLQSYSHSGYNDAKHLEYAERRFAGNEDVFGRFPLQTTEIDESYPLYIRENQDVLAHLIRKT
jgi:beta-1,4-mannosyl-glycoprotein beta-1,4-N-acetylglucosaminyltransferase